VPPARGRGSRGSSGCEAGAAAPIASDGRSAWLGPVLRVDTYVFLAQITRPHGGFLRPVHAEIDGDVDELLLEVLGSLRRTLVERPPALEQDHVAYLDARALEIEGHARTAG